MRINRGISDQVDRDNHRKMLKPYFVIVTRWLLTPKIDTNEILKKTAEARGISEIVVASRGGKTALKIAEAMGKKVHVISITEFSYSDDVKKKMKKLKMAPIENADLVIQDLREMNETLLMFGPGVKTALEVGAIAKQMELVKGEFIAVAGGKKGIDTAMVLDTVHPEAELVTEPVKQLAIKQIIASPLIT